MFALAAAHATRPSKVKGTQHLDIYDVRIIQYRSAILRLSDVIRFLGVLERNLAKKQDAGKTIIPLINYILSLCEGPVFNVHPVLKKRFSLLSECKLCKQNEINPPLLTSNVDYDVDFTPIVADLSQLRENIYNSNLQWKLMGCLRAISQNALDIYDKKLKQISLDRATKRPTDFPGRVVPLNYEAVDDILRPFEMELCLDWAVLINDRAQDTSLKSLRKLQLQVLTRFLSNINEKVLPVIRTYFNQLQKACNGRSPAVTNLKELPYWEFSVQRLYSYIYRILCILDVVISVARQLWLPNKDRFYSLKSRLSSENVHTFKEVLDKIDLICNEPKAHVTGTIIAILDSCSKPNLNITVTPNTVSDIFTNSICTVTPILRNTLQALTSWLDIWKFIDNNSDAHEKLENLNEEQLSSMLRERLTKDKINHIELQQKTNRPSADKNPVITGGLTRTGSTIKRGNSKRLSSPVSSNPTSPNKASPLRVYQNGSIDKSSSKDSSISSPLLSRRNSLVDTRVSSPTRQSGSPQISRRGSLKDSRSPGIKNAGDQKNAPRLLLANRITNGRSRSSSLQSDEAQKNSRRDAVAFRSNSLQAHATLNQRKIQDNFAQLRRSGSINGLSTIAGGPNGRKFQHSARKTTATQSLTSNPPASNRQGFKSISNTPTLSETEELNIDLDKDTKKQQVGQNLNRSSPEGPSIPHHQTKQQLDSKILFGDEQHGQLQEQQQQQQQQQQKKDNQGQEIQYKDQNSFTNKILSDERPVTQDEKEQLGKEETEEREQELTQNNHSSLHGSETSPVQEIGTSPSIMKKVRFAGVGPMTDDELAKPTKRGWYRKPAVLRYPPPPPQYSGPKFRLRQEGIAFRTSLREENTKEPANKRNSMVTTATFDEIAPPSQKESVSHRFTSKLRERLK